MIWLDQGNYKWNILKTASSTIIQCMSWYLMCQQTLKMAEGMRNQRQVISSRHYITAHKLRKQDNGLKKHVFIAYIIFIHSDISKVR